MKSALDCIVFKDASNMSKVKTGSAQLVVISPPFVGEIRPNHSTIDKIREKSLLKQLFTECVRVVRDNGVVVSINTDFRDKGMLYLRHMVVAKAAEEAGLKPKDEKIWIRSFKRDLYRKKFTFVLVFSKNGCVLNKRLPDYEKDNWVFTKPQILGKFRDAVAPEIPKMLIENFTDPGNLVVSVCAGSGTVVIETLRAGRRAVGYEINPLMKGFIRLREKTIAQFYSPRIELQDPAA